MRKIVLPGSEPLLVTSDIQTEPGKVIAGKIGSDYYILVAQAGYSENPTWELSEIGGSMSWDSDSKTPGDVISEVLRGVRSDVKTCFYQFSSVEEFARWLLKSNTDEED